MLNAAIYLVATILCLGSRSLWTVQAADTLLRAGLAQHHPSSSLLEQGHHHRDRSLHTERQTVMELIESTNATLNQRLADNAVLEAQKEAMEQEVADLNQSVALTRTYNARLVEENQNLEDTNQEYTRNLQTLPQQVETMAETVKELTETTQELSNEATALSAEAEDLIVTKTELTVTSNSLQSTLKSVGQQNVVLQRMVQDLSVISQYLTATNRISDISTTPSATPYSQVQLNLENETMSNRATAHDTLTEYYMDIAAPPPTSSSWTCRNDDLLAGQEFYEKYPDKSIERQSNVQGLVLVLNIIQDRVLEPLCLMNENFGRFATYLFYPKLSYAAALREITYNEMVDAVQQYTTLALEYYGSSTTPEQWEAAQFDCANLKEPFFWEDPR